MKIEVKTGIESNSITPPCVIKGRITGDLYLCTNIVADGRFALTSLNEDRGQKTHITDVPVKDFEVLPPGTVITITL